MTLSGMTPAEQVAALRLAVGDTIEGRQEGNRRVRLQLIGYIRCRPVWEHWFLLDGQWIWKGEGDGWPLETVSDWTKTASDPSIDPLTPLREEMRAGWAAMDRLYNLTSQILPKHEREPIREWLTRNAGFGQKGGE